MSGPHTARAPELDPVAAAVESAPEDERPATAEEIAALREAREDPRPLVSGAAVSAEIAERARREE